MSTYPYTELHALLAHVRELEQVVLKSLELCSKPSENLVTRILPMIVSANLVDGWQP